MYRRAMRCKKAPCPGLLMSYRPLAIPAAAPRGRGRRIGYSGAPQLRGLWLLVFAALPINNASPGRSWSDPQELLSVVCPLAPRSRGTLSSPGEPIVPSSGSCSFVLTLWCHPYTMPRSGVPSRRSGYCLNPGSRQMHSMSSIEHLCTSCAEVLKTLRVTMRHASSCFATLGQIWKRPIL